MPTFQELNRAKDVERLAYNFQHLVAGWITNTERRGFTHAELIRAMRDGTTVQLWVELIDSIGAIDWKAEDRGRLQAAMRRVQERFDGVKPKRGRPKKDVAEDAEA